jgi:hypothetical protein
MKVRRLIFPPPSTSTQKLSQGGPFQICALDASSLVKLLNAFPTMSPANGVYSGVEAMAIPLDVFIGGAE